MTVLDICAKLEETPVGVLVRESLYGFPILVGLHILGIALSVGTLLWVDLRLLGVSLQRARVTDVYRSLSPWFIAGFAVMFITGGMLFAGFATSAYGNPYFRFKVVVMSLAGANALVYHFTAGRRAAAWDEAARPPVAARAAGLVSLLIWASVIVAGRMISYTMF
jgi:hypothetical protein